MKNLYLMSLDFGRMGELEGKFFATPEEIKALIGKDIYFGEVLGKHSEVECRIDKEDIKLITDNQEFLQMAEDLNIDISSGYDPLEYYTCNDCGFPLNIITDECKNCMEDEDE